MERPIKTPDLKKNRSSLNVYAKYSAIAFQMAAVILIGLWGGIRLDEYLELSYPVFTILLTFLSLGAALYYLFRGITKNPSAGSG